MAEIVNTTDLTEFQQSSAVAATGSDPTFVQVLSQELQSRDSSDEYGAGINRIPWIFTSTGRKSGEIVPSAGLEWQLIFAALNPQEVSMTFAKRQVLEKCAGGEVLHSFEASEDRINDLGAYLDEPVFQFTMTSGNCLPVKITGSGDIAIPAGLDSLFGIVELVLEEPALLADNTENRIIISQQSVMFPSMTIEGYIIPDGVTVSMSAENPTEIQGVSFSVRVVKMEPRIGNHAALRARFMDQSLRVPA